MYSCSRKLDNIKKDLFNWSKEYKIANNIIWDEVVKKCSAQHSDLEGMDGMEE